MYRALVIAVVGAVFLAAALLATYYVSRQERVPEPQATAPTAPGNGLRAPAIAPRGVEPSFDIVRVSPEGNVVIAGRAPPGAEVTVHDGDTVVGKVASDARGEWVLVPTQPLAPGSRRLGLSAKLADGTTVKSGNDVVLVVPERGKDIAGGAAASATGALALRVPRDGKGLAPSTLLQAPGGPRTGQDELTIEVIDYDGEGRVGLAGTARPRSAVRIYLDNRAVGEARADSKGHWTFLLPEKLPPGDYALRVDELQSGGRVARRIEVPFNRAPSLSGLGERQIVVVQPGNSLWRIARRTYGEGMQYTLIFEANKAQIRDPNLIYPGQVFAVPRPRPVN